jgi:hypothetical protein
MLTYWDPDDANSYCSLTTPCILHQLLLLLLLLLQPHRLPRRHQQLPHCCWGHQRRTLGCCWALMLSSCLHQM